MSGFDKGKVWQDISMMREGISNDDWKDIVDRYELGIHPDSLRKSVTGMFGSYEMMKYFKENINEDELIREIEDKKLEIEKEKVRLQDERRVYKKYLRADARFERILDIVRGEIGNLKQLEVKPIQVENDKHTQASLLISDLHYGLTSDNYWNKFDTDVAIERMYSLADKTVSYCQDNKVNTIHIELLGDLISGIIHKTVEIENSENVISQVLNCSDLLSVIINYIANHVENVKLYMAVGNHSRVTANKGESIDKENFEYLVYEYIKLRVQRDNVEFMKNDIDDTMIHYMINDEHIFGVHGHYDKLNSIASDFSKMFKGMSIKEIHAGHLHHHYENEEYDIRIVMNGSVSGVDSYAKGIRKVGSPSQTLIVYKGNDTITYNIKL